MFFLNKVLVVMVRNLNTNICPQRANICININFNIGENISNSNNYTLNNW